MLCVLWPSLRRNKGGENGVGPNVLRLDEHDQIYNIDDAFTAQQMVRWRMEYSLCHSAFLVHQPSCFCCRLASNLTNLTLACCIFYHLITCTLHQPLSAKCGKPVRHHNIPVCLPMYVLPMPLQVPNSAIRVDRATLRRLRTGEVVVRRWPNSNIPAQVC